MDAVLHTAILVGVMLALMIGFRLLVRRPSGVGPEDPPGLRTVAVFQGDSADFFRDDHQDAPYVGVRLFAGLCDGLAAAGIRVENRPPLQNAQHAECVLDHHRLALVLEWFDTHWALSVEWVPKAAAERRHLAWTHQVYAPPDNPALRQLLAALNRWLQEQPAISAVRWHRKERWMAGDRSDPHDGPGA